jgi:hypothetical protein
MKKSTKTARISGLDLVYGVLLPFIFTVAFVLVLTRNTEVIPRDQFNVVFEFIAAVFFFIQGVSMNIHFQNASRPGKQVRFMRRQGSFFLVVGLVLASFWTVNIFVAIGLMLIISSFLMRLHSSILLFLAAAVAIASGGLYYFQLEFMVSMRPYSDGFQIWNSISAFLFYNGYYAFLPWYFFQLIGIAFCRSSLYRTSITVYVFGFLLIGAGILVHFYGEAHLGQNVLIARQSNKIPGRSFNLPSFIIAATGLSFIALQLGVYFIRQFKENSIIVFFYQMGKMKYSLLLAQMILGGILMFLFGDELFRKPLNLIILSVLFTVVAGYTSKSWLNKNKLGPVEKIFRKFSGK